MSSTFWAFGDHEGRWHAIGQDFARAVAGFGPSAPGRTGLLARFRLGSFSLAENEHQSREQERVESHHA